MTKQDEANFFAAFLLMPSPHFERAMRGVDLNDDEQVRVVAEKFKVTIGAVHYRHNLKQEAYR